MIGAPERERLSAIAARLEVDELALRLSIDELAPYPTIDVIAAIVHEFGVDPSWLLTGVYDSNVHRQSLQVSIDELPTAIASVIGRLTPRRSHESASGEQPSGEL